MFGNDVLNNILKHRPPPTCIFLNAGFNHLYWIWRLVFCKYLAQYAFLGEKFQAKVVPVKFFHRLVPPCSSPGKMVSLKLCPFDVDIYRYFFLYRYISISKNIDTYPYFSTKFPSLLTFIKFLKSTKCPGVLSCQVRKYEKNKKRTKIMFVLITQTLNWHFQWFCPPSLIIFPIRPLKSFFKNF